MFQCTSTNPAQSSNSGINMPWHKSGDTVLIKKTWDAFERTSLCVAEMGSGFCQAMNLQNVKFSSFVLNLVSFTFLVFHFLVKTY